MRQVALTIVLLLTISFSVMGLDGALYASYHTYLDVPVVGVRLSLPTVLGFDVAVGVESPSLLISETGRWDPPGIMPLQTAYTIEIERPLIGGWHIVYRHTSMHWHHLAKVVYGREIGPYGWYGDTEWLIEYRWTGN